MAAITGLLNLRKRYKLPNIRVKQIDNDPPDRDPGVHRRVIRFEHASGSPEWLISEVWISRTFHRWLSLPGEPERNDYGEFEGYRGANWTRRIKYISPVEDGILLLHPEAPAHLQLSLSVVLSANYRVRRRVRVWCSP